MINPNDLIRTRSGMINSSDKLVAFIYSLLRDHISAGIIEQLVRDAEIDAESQYSNGWIAQYAQDLASRLR